MITGIFVILLQLIANGDWPGDSITDGYVSFAEYVVRASWYFWEEYLLPIQLVDIL